MRPIASEAPPRQRVPIGADFRAVVPEPIAEAVAVADPDTWNRRTAMRDFELDASHAALRSPDRDGPAPAAGEPAPVAPGRSPALDAATLMHLQRTAGNAGVVQMLAGEEEQASPVHDVVGSGGGSSLDEGTRSRRWSRRSASRSTTSASTPTTGRRSRPSRSGRTPTPSGSDVVFKSGQYDPASSAGQRTIAHELSPRRPAVPRAGRRLGRARRHPRQRPVGPVRARRGRDRRPGDVRGLVRAAVGIGRRRGGPARGGRDVGVVAAVQREARPRRKKKSRGPDRMAGTAAQRSSDQARGPATGRPGRAPPTGPPRRASRPSWP